MKKIVLFLTIFWLIACKNTSKTPAKDSKKAIVTLQAKSNSNVSGVVTFIQENGMVTMILEAKGLTPGTHAIHIHEKADCSSADGSSAGGHWNPTHQPHGKWGAPEGYHKGDIGNITADANGYATMTFKTNQWCLDCDDQTSNLIGHSVIIHLSEDDFVTQPTGNAGGRISCGGIIELVQ